MDNQTHGDITQLLSDIDNGDDAAKDKLIDLAYDELRRLAAGLMRRERSSHTLQPTALVNEAAVKLMGSDFAAHAGNRSYFYGAMVRAMRRVLVDHARGKKAARRGGEQQALPLDEMLDSMEKKHNVNLIGLDDALQELELVSKRQADIVMMRFFGGFEMQEIADHLQVSLSTVEKEWRMARAWLRSQLQEEAS